MGLVLSDSSIKVLFIIIFTLTISIIVTIFPLNPSFTEDKLYYKSDQHRIAFTYPNNWEITTKSNSINITSPSENKEDFLEYITINLSSPNPNNFNYILQSFKIPRIIDLDPFGNDNNKVLISKNITFNDSHANFSIYNYTTANGLPLIHGIILFLNLDKTLYSISYFVEYNKYDNYWKIITEIIDSIKITETKPIFKNVTKFENKEVRFYHFINVNVSSPTQNSIKLMSEKEYYGDPFQEFVMIRLLSLNEIPGIPDDTKDPLFEFTKDTVEDLIKKNSNIINIAKILFNKNSWNIITFYNINDKNIKLQNQIFSTIMNDRIFNIFYSAQQEKFNEYFPLLNMTLTTLTIK